MTQETKGQRAYHFYIANPMLMRYGTHLSNFLKEVYSIRYVELYENNILILLNEILVEINFVA